MTRRLAAAMYLALAGLASAPAGAQDWSAVEALREGDMKKLVFSDPQPVPDIAVLGPDGSEISLAAYEGSWVVLNFWATWCAPCRVEMPTLAALQTEMAEAPVEVVTVATGRNSPQGIARFFDEIGVENLPQHRDPGQDLARAMAILGLPITVILDPEGREVARLRGDAHWDSESAIAILEALASGS